VNGQVTKPGWEKTRYFTDAESLARRSCFELRLERTPWYVYYSDNILTQVSSGWSDYISCLGTGSETMSYLRDAGPPHGYAVSERVSTMAKAERLHAEVSRLQALLRQYGIDPGVYDGATPEPG
jgi:hypothetical protein